MLDKFVFLLLLVLVAIPSPYSSPAVALVLGALFGLARPHPYLKESRKTSKVLLQASVVGLGFGMNLHQVLRAGASGFAYTAVGIAFALGVGMAFAKLLMVDQRSGYLIS